MEIIGGNSVRDVTSVSRMPILSVLKNFTIAVEF